METDFEYEASTMMKPTRTSVGIIRQFNWVKYRIKDLASDTVHRHASTRRYPFLGPPNEKLGSAFQVFEIHEPPSSRGARPPDCRSA